jgi:hypothetical protein
MLQSYTVHEGERGLPVEYEEAVNLILMHGIGRDDVPLDQALTQDGFLPSLRPYAGLREENFLQVLRAIIALAPHLAGRQVLERRLVSGLWELVQRARAWGLDPNGMIQRNKLMSAADTQRLWLWVTCLELAISRLLQGIDPSEADTYYRENRNGEQGAPAARGR